jgi:hypothetical protein
MRWWIDVLTPLANVTKSLDKKSRSHRVGASMVPIDRLARFIWESGPPRDTRLKRMRKIDIFLSGQSFSESSRVMLVLVRSRWE